MADFVASLVVTAGVGGAAEPYPWELLAEPGLAGPVQEPALPAEVLLAPSERGSAFAPRVQALALRLAVVSAAPPAVHSAVVLPVLSVVALPLVWALAAVLVALLMPASVVALLLVQWPSA